LLQWPDLTEDASLFNEQNKLTKSKSITVPLPFQKITCMPLNTPPHSSFMHLHGQAASFCS
jgi:hypothetical protein